VFSAPPSPPLAGALPASLPVPDFVVVPSACPPSLDTVLTLPSGPSGAASPLLVEVASVGSVLVLASEPASGMDVEASPSGGVVSAQGRLRDVVAGGPATGQFWVVHVS
jgi:hypothetical protein